MASDLDRNNFLGPGGTKQNCIGSALDSTVLVPTHQIHHVITTQTITTITPPKEGFSGPVYFIADSVFDWTTSGNIAPVPGTTLLANQAYGFIYDTIAGKWYSLGPTP